MTQEEIHIPTTPAGSGHAALDGFRAGEAPCLGCGYDRQGLPSRIPCPECGRVPPPDEAITIRGFPLTWLQASWLGQRIGCAGPSLAVIATIVVVTAYLSLVFLRGLAALRSGAGFGNVIASGSVATAVCVALLAWIAILRRRRPRGVSICFSLAGIHILFGRVAMRQPWSSVRTVSARRSVLRLHPRSWWTRTRCVRLDAPKETVARLAAAIEDLREAAARHPGASPPIDRYQRLRTCERCGALRPAAAKAATCEVCGEVFATETRCLFGLSSPRAHAKSLVRVALPTVLLCATTVGLACLTAIALFGFGRSVSLVFLAASVASAAGAAVLGGPAVRSLRVLVMVWRSRRTWSDRVWILRGERLDIACPDGIRALPRTQIGGVEEWTGPERWRRLRLLLPDGTQPPRDLWLSPDEVDCEDVVKTIRQRIAAQPGLAAATPPTERPS